MLGVADLRMPLTMIWSVELGDLHPTERICCDPTLCAAVDWALLETPAYVMGRPVKVLFFENYGTAPAAKGM